MKSKRKRQSDYNQSLKIPLLIAGLIIASMLLCPICIGLSYYFAFPFRKAQHLPLIQKALNEQCPLISYDVRNESGLFDTDPDYNYFDSINRDANTTRIQCFYYYEKWECSCFEDNE